MPHSTAVTGSPSRNNEDEVLSDAPPAGATAESSSKSELKPEEFFDDDDDDDEFPASSAPDTKPASAAPGPSGVDSDTMLTFYRRLFPFRYLFQWLNHGIVPSPDFGNREFAFTLQNEAYLRYQSYPTADLFRKDVFRINPLRFEIGPVYSTNPRDRKTLRGGQMKPVSKELVFDIDLTDYDDIRTCCSKADICNKCWAFVTMSIKVIDTALREDFGFDHILWVYSGRRGAHAWVCDPKARQLSDDRRRAIASYLEIVRGGDQSGKKVNLRRPLHPHVARSIKILEPYFNQTILTDQNTFLSQEQSDRLLSLLPDKKLRDALRKKWESAPGRSSTNKWNDIVTLAKTINGLDARALKDARVDIVLEYTYPRLDAEVSKKMIHLLKSPFVIHPGTGRVCVPIDGQKPERFDPLSVPTVTELLSDIDEYDSKHLNGSAPSSGMEVDGDNSSVPDRKIQDYEKTRLKPYVDYFRAFIANLNKAERSAKRERGDEGSTDTMEF
ncbi:hypothetical protein VTN31DRAFT_3491 [Thermomyces dupontii]|uniref:uncharacterized protein n=1 Tax=Talaromyces thermophilus TaxID=28565 RepID=UPI003743BEFB